MLAIMNGLMVVSVQQALEDLDRFMTGGGLGQVPASRNEVFIAGRYITTASVAHDFSPSRDSDFRQHLVKQCPRVSCILLRDLLNSVADVHEYVVARLQ